MVATAHIHLPLPVSPSWVLRGPSMERAQGRVPGVSMRPRLHTLWEALLSQLSQNLCDVSPH